jgi:hypothetical protein
MRADGSIIIDTTIDDSGFRESLKKIEDYGEKSAKAIEKDMKDIKPPGSRSFQAAFDRIGRVGKKAIGGIVTAAKGMAMGIGVAAIALAGYTVAAIKGAEADEAQNKQLKQVAKSMGLFGDEADTVADRLAKLADKNELLLGVDAEIIKSTQLKLLTFKELAETADELGGAFDRATMLAIDLAAAGFGDATSNAVQLGKALNDPIKGITALNRSGVTFTENERKKIKTLVESNRLFEAQDVILRAIEKQVGGTALASVKASDQLVLMANAVGDALGAAFLPIVRDLMPAVGDFVTGLTPLMAGLGTAIADMIAQVGSEEQVMAAAEALGNYLGDAMVAAAPIVATALNAMLLAVASTIGAMAEGISAMAVAIVGAIGSNIGNIVQPMIEGMLVLLTELIRMSDQWLTPITEGALEIINLLITELVKPENIALLVDAGMTLGAALMKGILSATLFGNHNILMGVISDIKAAGNGQGVANTRPPVAMPIHGTGTVPRPALPIRTTPKTSGGITVHFNQPVQSYSDTITAMRAAERNIGW